MSFIKAQNLQKKYGNGGSDVFAVADISFDIHLGEFVGIMAMAALEAVGLAEKAKRLPGQISGGEKERTAIARAIANEPPVLLADEPTGNLDSKTSEEIMALMQRLNRQGTTIVMVTHSRDCAAYTQRLLTVADGRLVGAPILPG